MSDEEFNAARRVIERHGYVAVPRDLQGGDVSIPLLRIQAFLRGCGTSVVGTFATEGDREGGARNYFVPDDLSLLGRHSFKRTDGSWLLDVPTERIKEILESRTKGTDAWYALRREVFIREFMNPTESQEGN